MTADDQLPAAGGDARDDEAAPTVVLHRRRRRRVDGRWVVVAFGAGALLALAIVVVAIVSSSSSSAPKASPPGPPVQVRHARIGRILVNSRGLTLYLFLADHRGKSTCVGSCADVWPPLYGRRPQRAGPGVRTQHLTTIHRRGGRQQIAYYGHPLYTMSADTRPGQLEGEGFGGAWFAVSPAGKAIVAPGTHIKKGGGY